MANKESNPPINFNNRPVRDNKIKPSPRSARRADLIAKPLLINR